MSRANRKHSSREEALGFTMIEIMLVLALIGLLEGGDDIVSLGTDGRPGSKDDIESWKLP
jgi:prepilin-type N-terminal cleavage/methylation domain-containing protein